MSSDKTKKDWVALPEDAVFKGYHAIHLNEIPVEDFTESEIPEMIVWGIFGDFEKDQAEEVLNTIINKLREVSKSDKIPDKYINNLVLFSRLRDLDEFVTQKLKDMAIFTDELVKSHALYKEGKKEGVKEAKAKATKAKTKAIVNLMMADVDIEIIKKAFKLTQKELEQLVVDWHMRDVKGIKVIQTDIHELIIPKF